MSLAAHVNNRYHGFHGEQSGECSSKSCVSCISFEVCVSCVPSGTFCTVDIALRRLRALAPDADTAAVAFAVAIPDIVAALRQQRRGMVQTPDQYLFCNQAMLDELQEP